MEVRSRALYNLIRSNWLQDRSLDVKDWQVEDYRSLDLDEIWARLEKLGIVLDQKSFELYAADCENPEELVDCLFVNDRDVEGYDQAYLLLFELWRRLLPHSASLSIFCDELDYRIDLYEMEHDRSEELIQEALIQLEDILDQNVDQGSDPKAVFSTLIEYCAHDIESFLYNFISDQITAHNEMYASEIIDGFYEYISDVKWFDFLRIRVISSADPEEGNRMMRRLAETLEESPDLDLLLEMSCFLVHYGNPTLFIYTIKLALSQIAVEEEFQELLAIAADFYCCFDMVKQENEVEEIFMRRKNRPPSSSFNQKDPDRKQFFQIIDHSFEPSVKEPEEV